MSILALIDFVRANWRISAIAAIALVGAALLFWLRHEAQVIAHQKIEIVRQKQIVTITQAQGAVDQKIGQVAQQTLTRTLYITQTVKAQQDAIETTPYDGSMGVYLDALDRLRHDVSATPGAEPVAAPAGLAHGPY
jgi:hypothetical protein